jgi:hypothetical protein
MAGLTLAGIPIEHLGAVKVGVAACTFVHDGSFGLKEHSKHYL